MIKKKSKGGRSPKKPIPSSSVLSSICMGILRVHPRGFGFVQPADSSLFPEEVFIPKQFTHQAIDGDTVEVEINLLSRSEKGPEGRVVSILKRGRSHLSGTIYLIEGKIYVIHCPLLGASKPVNATFKRKLKIGDRVTLKISSWGSESAPISGEISEVFGHISDPSIDIKAALKEYDLRIEFPSEVLKQLSYLGKTVVEKDLKNREDFTKITTVTIDPETAKDFDDALSLSKDSEGHYHLGVHIADVSHYVTRDSALDQEAQERCNSTYFPGTCIPMLPYELSDHLCSLKPDVIRLTVSVVMELDKNGTLLSSRVVRSYIQSAKRFSYEEAKEVLDGVQKSPYLALLQLMVELALLLKKKRQERGSIDFSLPELVLQIDEQGNPTGTKIVQYDITHQLVEEYMLKANEIVAKTLEDRKKPVVFRIHEHPDKDNMEDFYTLARTFGFSLGKAPSQKEIQQLFEKAQNSPHAAQLSISFIRSMKLAYYSSENVGHFGLALEHYCHFTSPIRRYTDLIIQRLLFGEEGENLQLEQIALKCSDQERISFKAESSVKNLKKLRLLDKWIKDDPYRIYQAITTKVKPFGIFFEIPDIMLEGFLHVSELEDDYFLFNPNNSTFTGRSSGKVHKTGELLQVRPVAIDLILLETKWELAKNKRRKKK